MQLLVAIQTGIPRHRSVLVLADRGIGTSPDLMRGVTKQSKLVLPDGQSITFYDQVNVPNQSFQASGQVFKTGGRIPAQVRVLWAQGA